jgi:hypothetical protein
MKRPIAPPEQLSDEQDPFITALNDEPDMACVVVSAAYLDAALASLLARFLLRTCATSEDLLSPRGALNAFKARADLSYVLALIPEEVHKDLGEIAKIRNVFAHSHLHLTFENPDVQKGCARLRTFRGLGQLGASLSQDDRDATPDERRGVARNRFTVTVAVLSQRLIVNARALAGAASSQVPALSNAAVTARRLYSWQWSGTHARRQLDLPVADLVVAAQPTPERGLERAVRWVQPQTPGRA